MFGRSTQRTTNRQLDSDISRTDPHFDDYRRPEMLRSQSERVQVPSNVELPQLEYGQSQKFTIRNSLSSVSLCLRPKCRPSYNSFFIYFTASKNNALQERLARKPEFVACSYPMKRKESRCYSCSQLIQRMLPRKLRSLITKINMTFKTEHSR